MPSAWSGMNWIAGGAAAAILLPVLAIGVGMPFWIAGIISAAAGGGLVVLLSPRKLFEGLDASGVARGKIEFARSLLTDAEPLAVRLEVAVSSIGTPKVAERVRHLARISREIFAAVEEDPLRVDRVRRFPDLLSAACGRSRGGLCPAGKGQQARHSAYRRDKRSDRPARYRLHALCGQPAGSRSRQSRHRAQIAEEFA